MDILQRIKDIRESKNMSVYELAKRCDISKNTIYRWYSKNYIPTLDTLQIICEKGFEISLVEFFAVDCDLIPATDEVKELISIWSTLTQSQKQAIKQIMLSYKK
ncbi:MAG: helix-turn-helix domain-containing protein [Christensenellales bacterium]